MNFIKSPISQTNSRKKWEETMPNFKKSCEEDGIQCELCKGWWHKEESNFESTKHVCVS